MWKHKRIQICISSPFFSSFECSENKLIKILQKKKYFDSNARVLFKLYLNILNRRWKAVVLLDLSIFWSNLIKNYYIFYFIFAHLTLIEIEETEDNRLTMKESMFCLGCDVWDSNSPVVNYARSVKCPWRGGCGNGSTLTPGGLTSSDPTGNWTLSVFFHQISKLQKFAWQCWRCSEEAKTDKFSISFRTRWKITSSLIVKAT